MRDPSSFYRLNEEIALELQRLERAGALDRLLELVGAADVELAVTSVRAREGLEELLGVLRERREGAPVTEPRRGLRPDHDGGAGCTPPAEDAVDAVRAELASPAGGWDHEGYLATRSQFTVVLDGEPREVYMPDHVCPSCLNDAGNAIDACSRVCAACSFAW